MKKGRGEPKEEIREKNKIEAKKQELMKRLIGLRLLNIFKE